MAEEKDLKKMITDREAELQPVYSRMDEDQELYWLKAFKMKDSNNREIPHVENVTLNKPRVFADRIISVMLATKRQTIIKSEEMDDKQKAEIKDFYDDVDYEIDNLLAEKGIAGGLDSCIISQLALRGASSERCELYKEGNNIVFDVMPWDTRFEAYHYHREGLDWASYRSSISKDNAEKEYRYEGTDSPVNLISLYRPKINTIFVGDNQGMEPVVRKIRWDYTPVIFEKNHTSVYMRGTDSIEHEGESIYAANRKLYQEMNLMMSIMQTLTVASFFGGLQYKGREGEDAEKPELPPYGLRFVVPVEKDGGYSAMPINDIHNATRLGYTILEKAIQEGSLPPTEYGSLEFPMSAVGLKELGQGRDQIVLPILDAWATNRQKLAMMIKDQYMALGVSATFGTSGKPKRKYDPKLLDGNYTVEYRFAAVSPKDDIANITIAQSLGGMVSEDTKRRDYIKLENPDAEVDKINKQKAIESIPEYQMYEQARSLIRQGDEVGAQIIASRLSLTLTQIESGKIAPELLTGGNGQQPEQMIPMMSKGAQRKSGLERQEEVTLEPRAG